MAATPAPAAAVDWRRNLVVLWLAEFTAIFGFSCCYPFLPIYLHSTLGIADQRELALWTGITAGAGGLGLAFLSPVWGVMADRYGRKAMLLRSILGGAITVGLIGFAQSAGQVAGLRLLQGATTGTVTAANSLVVAETPRNKLGSAMGVLSSSVAIGGAVAPLAGALLVAVIGVRLVFVAAALLLLAAALPVVVAVKETPRPRLERRAPRTLAVIRAAAPGTLGALAVLTAAQGLMQFAYTAAQQLAVLRLIRLDPTSANLEAGLGYAVAGLGATLAAFLYVRVARRVGFLKLAIGAALVLTAAIVGLAAADSIPLLVAGMATGGFLYGALLPCAGSMLGLEAPTSVQSTVFGVNASALAAGTAAGPFVTGAVASVWDVRTGLLVAAGGALVLTLVLGLWGREPAPA